MKRLIFPIAFVATTLCAAAIAQDAPSRNGSYAIRRIEHRLGVTAAQREQAKAILAAERPTIAQLRQQAQAERAEMDAQPFNETQTRDLANKYAQTNTAILVERTKVRSEILGLLTPEQRTKLEQFRAQFEERMNSRLETLGGQL